MFDGHGEYHIQDRLEMQISSTLSFHILMALETPQFRLVGPADFKYFFMACFDGHWHDWEFKFYIGGKCRFHVRFYFMFRWPLGTPHFRLVWTADFKYVYISCFNVRRELHILDWWKLQISRSFLFRFFGYLELHNFGGNCRFPLRFYFMFWWPLRTPHSRLVGNADFRYIII